MLIAVGLMVRQVWLAPAASVQTQELANINHDNRNYPVPAPSITAAAPSQSEVPGKFTPPVNVSVSSHPKVRQQANVNRGIDEKEGISSNTSDGNVGGGSNVFAVRSALPSITPPGIPDPLTQPGALVAVPVQTSTKSATLTLSYGRAKPQMLLLRPVTFGAQDVFEQGDDQRTLISSAQGVW
jgi:hypothetical protein